MQSNKLPHRLVEIQFPLSKPASRMLVNTNPVQLINNFVLSAPDYSQNSRLHRAWKKAIAFPQYTIFGQSYQLQCLCCIHFCHYTFHEVIYMLLINMHTLSYVIALYYIINIIMSISSTDLVHYFHQQINKVRT